MCLNPTWQMVAHDVCCSTAAVAAIDSLLQTALRAMHCLCMHAKELLQKAALPNGDMRTPLGDAGCYKKQP